jgi:membrane protein implicated in regulation of membrane protease activity
VRGWEWFLAGQLFDVVSFLLYYRWRERRERKRDEAERSERSHNGGYLLDEEGEEYEIVD